MDSRQLAGALHGLSDGLGAFAGYEAQKEQFAMQQAAADRRDASNKAFQVMLYNARSQQNQQQFEATREDRAAERAAMSDYRNRSLEAQSQYHADTLAAHQDSLQIAQQNADTAKQRADTDAKTHGTDRTATVLSSRLTATGRLIQNYTTQRDKEIAARMKAISADFNLMADPAAADRARDTVVREVTAKYQPLIDKRQAEYERLNAKFGELTGVPMGDAEEAATMAAMAAEAHGAGTPATPGASTSEDDATALPAVGAGVPGQSPGYRSAPGPGNLIRSLADIPPGAVDYLREHPETLAQFNAKYGPGTGEQVLGKSTGGE